MMWEHEQTSTTNTTPSQGAKTPSPSATPSQSNSTPTNTSVPHSGLSTGAEAGIGVGVALVVIIGLVLLWLGWRHTKRRRALSGQAGKYEGTKESSSKRGQDVKYTPVELDHHGLHEMQAGVPEAPGEELRHEVDGQHNAYRHEWEGSGR